MPSASIVDRGTLVVTQVMREQAEAVLERASDSQIDTFTLSVDGKSVEVGHDLAQLLVRVISCAAHDGTIRIATMPSEVTTTVAAQEIGVSRPTLMKMIAEKRIPAHKIGSHTRLKFVDVLEAKVAIREGKAAAFESLRALSEELGEV